MNRKLFPLVAVGTALMCGCVVGPRVEHRTCNSTGGMEVAQSENAAARTSVDDPCFSKWLAVESAVVKRSTLGIPVADVRLWNVSRDDLDFDREDDFTFQYRFSWFDASGMAVLAEEGVWRHETILGGEGKNLQGCAPSADATQYVLRIRHVGGHNR
ncbi:MAG: DUF1425 domain-containing protein [Kiritimatiellia bacterium]